MGKAREEGDREGVGVVSTEWGRLGRRGIGRGWGE